MVNKLEDTKAACNIIKRMRAQARNLKRKCISISIIIDNEIKAINRTDLDYNPSTGHIGISTLGLKCKGIYAYPTKNQKLKCTNQHALDMLEKIREYDKMRRIKQKR